MEIKIPVEPSYGQFFFILYARRLEVRLMSLLGYGEEQLPRRYSYPHG